MRANLEREVGETIFCQKIPGLIISLDPKKFKEGKIQYNGESLVLPYKGKEVLYNINLRQYVEDIIVRGCYISKKKIDLDLEEGKIHPFSLADSDKINDIIKNIVWDNKGELLTGEAKVMLRDGIKIFEYDYLPDGTIHLSCKQIKEIKKCNNQQTMH